MATPGRGLAFQVEGLAQRRPEVGKRGPCAENSNGPKAGMWGAWGERSKGQSSARERRSEVWTEFKQNCTPVAPEWTLTDPISRTRDMQLTRKLFAAGAPARGDVPGARQRPLVRPSTGGDSRIG